MCLYILLLFGVFYFGIVLFIKVGRLLVMSIQTIHKFNLISNERLIIFVYNLSSIYSV